MLAFEVLAVAAVALAWPHVAWSELIPYSIPLVIAAALFRKLHARAEPPPGERIHIIGGMLAGLAALALAIIVGTPLVEAISNHAVEWSGFAVVRGSSAQLAVFVVWVAVSAIAAELALRGWIVERALELSGTPALAVAVGAVAEAALTPGGLGVRAGAAVFGVGLGWMYVAGGRSVSAPLCARLAFSVGALLLDGLRIV